MTNFKPVSSQVDFPALERELLNYWYKEGIIKKYLHKNDSSDKKFSFLDGPITANNPMGVHHAWGRTYKDLWQRFYNMKGFAGRFQNGFDEQGLWVEVGVEKDLGLKDKKDIENLIPGDKFTSIDKFVNLCKERVEKYSSIQTEQSKRLGYFMNWDNSYHTSSDENNYAIWNFLKVVNEKGWLYKGHDSVPWCPRCGTAISQHEILTEEYKELTHNSIYMEYPILGKKNEYILIWTTTPWTLPANVVVAVDPDKDYVAATGTVQGNIYYLGKEAASRLKLDVIKNIKGKDLVGLQYSSPFDNLPRVQKALSGYQHQVIATDPLVLPISDEEGTGLVHIAPGAGSEDYQLGQKNKLPVIEVIDEGANYLEGMDDYSGKNAKNNPELIIDFLKSYQEGEFLFDVVPYTHRYPTCWRCKTELVWRVVDEWYIAMDRKDDSGQTYREQMVEVAKKIHWLPKWGLDRELDWLKNMHDWLISKKRYWGLALPIWECPKCGSFEIVSSKDELKEKSIEGWEKFEGHSPHKPWIDEIKVKCSKCGALASRIPDVGNPWLDAGIVPFSTLPEDWFPADFVTEAFPGQFKNWFYSMIAMSTALKKTNPFKNLLGHAMVMDEKGEEMHKSKGNAIEFNEAADKIGVDVMRWLYVTQNPEHNLHFGFNVADEIRRRFYLILWNSYKFFVEYALLSDLEITKDTKLNSEKLTILDKWILVKFNQLVSLVNKNLEKYDAMSSSRLIEDFVINDLSTWYIRRSRGRVGPSADETDKQIFLETSYYIFVNLSKLLAPFMPFIAEEMYRNLTSKESVHLADFPTADEKLIDKDLIKDMAMLKKLVEIGHSLRKEANIKLRQPLGKFTYYSPIGLGSELEKILADELNVKSIEYKNSSKEEVKGEMDTKITPQLQAEGEARDLIRQVQQLRKDTGLTLKDQVKIVAPNIPGDEKLIDLILKQTNAVHITTGEKVAIEVVQ